jgi:hypothetical protein
MAGDIFGGKFQDILTRGKPSRLHTNTSSPRRHRVLMKVSYSSRSDFRISSDRYVLSGCPVQKSLGGSKEMKKDGQVNQRPAEHEIANDFHKSLRID